MGALSAITFDMSLARGLDYYTGLIYEAVPTGLPEGVSVGSMAAGGRYDNLVGMFSGPGTITPCVGVSIGMERVFAIMEAHAAAATGGLRRTPVSVLVAAVPSSRGTYDMAAERMRALGEIWAAGFSGEMVFAPAPKLVAQMNSASEAGVPFLVILAEDELDRGEVQVKDFLQRKDVKVKRENMIETLLGMGAVPTAKPATGLAGSSSSAAAAVGAAGNASV
jgi:histidyl-tRNA synthetase